MKTLAHLNALRAFEAAARHQSFSAAAQELHVTPAAVGQLVRTLEDWLQAPVFVRQPSGRTRLVPTEAAQRALPDIRAGLDRLADGLAKLSDASMNGVLTVTVSPAFAAKWLLPRLERFQLACPDTDVRIDTSLKPVDFAAQGIDIGVRYGTGQWPGLVAEKLLSEELYPVCSPVLLKQLPRIRHARDLAHATLIHDLSMDGQSGFPSWASWLQATGGQNVSTRRGLKINNSAAVLQAAIDGLGVALARSVMSQDDLASGRLVRLLPEVRMASPLAYYVVYGTSSAAKPRVKAFRDWLMAEVAKQPASGFIDARSNEAHE